MAIEMEYLADKPITPSMLTPRRLDGHFSTEMVTSRIKKDVSPQSLCNKVFLENQSVNFIHSLTQIAKREGATLEVGGRSIREAIGCGTFDFAQHVVSDAELIDDLGGVEKVRLLPLIKYLRNFPEGRMTRPDLDFIIAGLSLDTADLLFKESGFKTRMNIATGGINVLDVFGSGGTASFVKAEDSVQKKDCWPKYGFTAPFVFKGDVGNFAIDISRARMYAWPLEMGIRGLKVDSPDRYSSVGRALLWSLTATNPSGDLLKLPCEETLEMMCETVASLPFVLGEIERGKVEPRKYGGAIRDLALSLRIIELSENLGDPFFRRVSGAYWSGRGGGAFIKGL